MLLPIKKRNELDAKYITELVDDIYKLAIPSEAKISFMKYTKARTKDDIQRFRSQVIYHLFNSDTAFGLAKGKEKNIDNWYHSVKEILEPSIALLNEQDQQKVIMLLAKEKADLDGNVESRRLFERFVDYI